MSHHSISKNSLFPSSYSTSSTTFGAGQPNDPNPSDPQKDLHTNLSFLNNDYLKFSFNDNTGRYNVKNPSVQNTIHLDRPQDLQYFPAHSKCSVASVTDKQLVPAFNGWRGFYPQNYIGYITQEGGSSQLFGFGAPYSQLHLGQSSLQHSRIFTAPQTNNRIFTEPTKQCGRFFVRVPDLDNFTGNAGEFSNFDTTNTLPDDSPVGQSAAMDSGSILYGYTATGGGNLTLYSYSSNAWAPDTSFTSLTGNFNSVSLSKDKNLVAGAISSNNSNAGQVVVYDISSGSSVEVIGSPFNGGADSRLGFDVDLVGTSTNWNIFMGAPGVSGSQGVVTTKNGSVPGGTGVLNLGRTVAGLDVTTGIASSTNGKVYLILDNGTSVTSELIVDNVGTNTGFALNAHDKININSVNDSSCCFSIAQPDAKTVHIYSYDANRNPKTKLERKFTQSSASTSFGASVALMNVNGFGYVAVGDPNKNTVYLYSLIYNRLVSKYTVPSAEYTDFGIELSANGITDHWSNIGDTLSVGANALNGGAVVLFLQLNA